MEITPSELIGLLYPASGYIREHLNATAIESPAFYEFHEYCTTSNFQWIVFQYVNVWIYRTKHLFVSYIYLVLLLKQNAQLGFTVTQTCLAFDDTWHMQNKRRFSGYTVSCSHCKGSALCVTDKQPCIALKSPSSYINFGHIKTMKYMHRTCTNTIIYLEHSLIEC